jgi:hypothetical protein
MFDRRAFLDRCLQFAATPVVGAFGLRAVAPELPFAGERRAPHHAPRARSVIFLYMDGGPSQMDTFDPSPACRREHGKPFGQEGAHPVQRRRQHAGLAVALRAARRQRPVGQRALPARRALRRSSSR